MHININRLLTIAMITLVFSFACFGTNKSEANEPSTAKASQSDTAQKLTFDTQINSDAIRAAKAEIRAEMYKNSADSLKWALGIIIGLVIIFIGYAIFKNTREYKQALIEVKEAVSQVRDACKEARDASDRARDYEEKAQQRLGSIDKEVAAKLKQIEVRGQESVTKLTKEAEKQRQASQERAKKELEISELFGKYQKALQEKDFILAADYCEQAIRIDPRNPIILNNLGACLIEIAGGKANAEADKLYEQSCQKCGNAVAIQADYYPAWNNWGNAIFERGRNRRGDEAANMFKQSCEKYKRAVQIKEDLYVAWSNWGNAVAELAQTKRGNEADELFKEAFAKHTKAIAINPSYYVGWNNWGVCLLEKAKTKTGGEADQLFNDAYAKYEKSLSIKPDYDAAWNNWGVALLYQAKKKTGKRRNQLFDEVKDKCLKAESIKTGEGSYNLACVYARLGDEKECQKWLKTGEQAGTLSTRKHAMGDDDLKSVRSKKWFKEIRWKGE